MDFRLIDVGKLAVRQARKLVLMMADTELIQRCQQGDQAAFEELVKRYERKVYGLIYHIMRSANEVEDVAQEVFTKLFFSLPQFRLSASFDAWLYRITVNQCYDFLRKRKRSPQAMKADLSEEEVAFFESYGSVTQPQNIDIGKRMEMRQVAENLLSALSPQERSLLVLKEIEELSIQELMEIFKTSRSAIKLRLFRARNHLKAVYERSKKRERK